MYFFIFFFFFFFLETYDTNESPKPRGSRPSTDEGMDMESPSGVIAASKSTEVSGCKKTPKKTNKTERLDVLKTLTDEIKRSNEIMSKMAECLESYVELQRKNQK